MKHILMCQLSLLFITSGLLACTSSSPHLVSQVQPQAAKTTFLCESALREQRFIDAANKMQVSKQDAQKLYRLSGAHKQDQVTGFAIASDRQATVERAIQGLSDNEISKAYYVEVDIRNLGGLNQKLGHNGADKVFSNLAKLTEQQIQALASDSCSFRHGGDEFSFLVFGSEDSQQDVEMALNKASQKIQHYIAEQGLSQIKHPKHPGDASKLGVGIIFGVSQIQIGEDIDRVFSAADKLVEKKKLSTSML